MKRIFYILFTLFLFTSCSASSAEKAQEKAEEEVTESAKIEVYYFHYSHRCVTCKAVEAVSQEAINELYPDLLKSGGISFSSVNLDERSSKNLAEKHKVEGQSLLVISGNFRKDLTEKGFMYARNSPDKLKKELKETIDSLIK